MVTAAESKDVLRFADKEALARQLEAQDRALGFMPVLDASHERLRAMMLADGIRPEENSGSREIIAMREEKIRDHMRRNSPQRELPLEDDAP